MNSDIPYIHLFKNSMGYFIFYVNTVKILNVPEDFFEDFTNNPIETQEWSKNSSMYLEELKKEGYLSGNRVKESKHPLTECLEDLVNHKLSHITLQVTQKCNLRCEYCVYSGEYINRKHSNERMSSKIMRKSVDYLIKHSSDADRIVVSFYGGEPLLEFDLIKKCVKYIKLQMEGRTVTFSFTTNGTLLTKEKLEFLIEHDFRITISIDGPEKIHNKHRKYANTSIGSFEQIINNLEYI